MCSRGTLTICISNSLIVNYYYRRYIQMSKDPHKKDESLALLEEITQNATFQQTLKNN